MSTPYIGFSNDTLNALPPVKPGEPIICPSCGGKHNLIAGKSDHGEDSSLMVYHCGEKTYLGAINGKLVFNAKQDC